MLCAKRTTRLQLLMPLFERISDVALRIEKDVGNHDQAPSCLAGPVYIATLHVSGDCDILHRPLLT